MSAPGYRRERLQDQIRMEAAEMILLELKDPRIGPVDVTRVELSPDLRIAHVWIDVPGEEDVQQSSLEGLSSAAGYLRHEIGLRLGLQRVPQLVFNVDRGPQDALRVESLLEKIHGQS